MRFQAAHKLVTYLLVLAALGALGTTRTLAPAGTLCFLLVAAASFGVDAGNRMAAALDRGIAAARAVTGALLLVIVWRIWRRMPDADLAPAFDLVLVLLGYKLLYRRNHRDYVHIYALSFLLVVVASTITATFLFMVTFASYVVLGTWGLILFHLRREMEENYLVRHSAQAPSQKVGIGRILSSRRVVGGAFFGATLAVAAAVFLGAVAIFALVPRPGAGFVLGGRGPVGVIGLSDEVAIGRYGTLAGTSHEVVLRAAIPRLGELADDGARRAAAEALYFRGAVYDRYERGRWIRSRRPELRTVLRQSGNRTLVGELGGGPGASDALGGTVRQEIEAVGVPAAVLFALDRPVALELPAAHLGALGSVEIAPRWSGETALRVGGSDTSDGFLTLAYAHYVVYSATSGTPKGFPNPPFATSGTPKGFPNPPFATSGTPKGFPNPPAMGSAGQSPASPDAIDSSIGVTLDPVAREDYLAWPPGLGRMAALGTELAAGRDDGGKVAAVVAWLRANHAYTNRPLARPGDVDPVEDFLFAQPVGHCELFASAAVLLLRAAGVPARYVTGFRGGSWNAIGDYVSVRDERAHAWAEAFVPGSGWVRVDATPPAAGLAPSSRLGDVSDALDFFWNRWVVGYDLGRQRDLLARTSGRLGGRLAGTRLGLGLALLAALGGLGWGARRLGRRLAARRPSPRPELPRLGSGARAGAVDRLYRRTLARLARGGWPRRVSETPHEYASRMRLSGVLPGRVFDDLTERYSAARFGGHPPAGRAVADLGRALAAALARQAPGEKTGRVA